VSKTGEHGAHEGGDRVHPEVVTELFVHKVGDWNVVAELYDFENGLSDAYSWVKASAAL